ARDHVVIKIPDDAQPSTSKIDVAKTSTNKIDDDDDGAKTSSTGKIDVAKTSTNKIDDHDDTKTSSTNMIDEIEEILDEDGSENQAV
ncbi:hypothetical protein A2U01_0084547, partial [Trifolium medium]|nr:hypothetical protein [Trifolium medium]